ncbi:hypothetical protein AYY16_00635 [Morganella psychrotolerans]|nr:hypothetical protein AYY16_00635 [Morganella psychrotolerans]
MIKNDDAFDCLIKNHAGFLMRIQKLQEENTARLSAANSKHIFSQLRIKSEALTAAEIILHTLC